MSKKLILTLVSSFLILFFYLISINYLKSKSIYSISNLYCALSVKFSLINLKHYCDYTSDLLLKSDLQKQIIIETEDTNSYIIKGLDQGSYKINNKNYLNQNDWLRSHGNYESTNYSNIDKINKKNVKNINHQWEFVLGKASSKNIETNPIFFDNKIFLPDLNGNIVALNAANGQVVWKKKLTNPIARRGLVIDKFGIEKNSLYVNHGKGLTIFNTKNGEIIYEIGQSNKIVETLNKYSRINYMENKISLVPPIITNDSIILAFSNSEITSYDFTNKINWTVNLRKDKILGASIWGGISYDEENDYILAVTGNPRTKGLSNQFIGINRPGDNLYSNSIVCINAKNGKILWHFQDTIHDLWDYDISFPPIISNIKTKLGNIRVVSFIGKSGNLFVLDLHSGKSIYDYKMVQAPQSKIFGEETSKFQPESIHPKRLIKLEINKDDLSNLNEDINEYVNKIYVNGISGKFLPPEINKNLIVNGPSGGGQWFGGAVSPSGIMYAQINKIPFIIDLKVKQKIDYFINNDNLYIKKCAECHSRLRNGLESKKLNLKIPSIAGLSLTTLSNKKEYFNKIKNNHKSLKLKDSEIKEIINEMFEIDTMALENKDLYYDSTFSYFEDQFGNIGTKPPWGEIVAVDINEGKLLWKIENGSIEVSLDKHNTKNVLGSPSYGGVLLLKSDILVTTGSYDNKSYFIDALNGNLLHSIKMEAPGSAPPTTYLLDDEQYIAFVATGNIKKNGSSAKIVVYKLSTN